MNRERLHIKVGDIKKTNCFIPECLEHALTLFEENYNIPVSAAYTKSWNFEMKNSSKITDSIIMKNTLFDDLREYSGLKVGYIKINQTQEIIAAIEENLNNGFPTLFHLDTYFCDWGMFYKQIHSQHVAIATGIDYEKRKIWIIDPDFSAEAFQIEFSLLDIASKFYFKIEIEKKVDITNRELLNMVIENRLEYEKLFDNIIKFAELFREKFNPAVEFEAPNDIDCVLDSELIFKFRNIIKARNMFIVFLERCQEEFPICAKVVEYLIVSMGKWNTIMNLIFKSARTRWREGFNERIYNILLSIEAIEREAFEVLSSGTICNRILNDNFKELASVECIKVDIEALCNNRGFLFDDKHCKADLTSAGEYFQLNAPYNTITFKGIAFDTYFGKEYDNIICRNQEIFFPINTEVSGFAILLCAEWGMCEDAITIKYSSDSCEVFKVVAYDISQVDMCDTMELGSSILESGEVVNSRAGVTVKCINFCEPQHVKSIILPNNPNIHILSISAYAPTLYADNKTPQAACGHADSASLI